MKKQYLGKIGEHPLLGKLLPVDFSPLKTCSFNCYYCNLGKTTNMSLERKEFFPVGVVITFHMCKIPRGLYDSSVP